MRQNLTGKAGEGRNERVFRYEFFSFYIVINHQHFCSAKGTEFDRPVIFYHYLIKYNSTIKFNTCIFACYIFGLLKLRYALKQLYMNKLPNEVCPIGYV